MILQQQCHQQQAQTLIAHMPHMVAEFLSHSVLVYENVRTNDCFLLKLSTVMINFEMCVLRLLFF